MDKIQLQWLLVGIGVVIVALIFLWAIRSRIKQGIRSRRRRPEREPALGETTVASFAEEEVRAHDFGDLGYITATHHLADRALVDVEIHPVHRECEAAPLPPEVDANAEADLPQCPEPAMPPQMTVALTVMAPPHRPFPGTRIQAVAEELQFRLGMNGLFEHFTESDPDADTPVFSMAHLREPGSFDVKTLHELKTPGLLLFMNLPGPLEGTKALNVLVLTADQWAQRLGGVICDGRRNRMTNQALMQLREQVSDLERQLRAWAQSL